MRPLTLSNLVLIIYVQNILDILVYLVFSVGGGDLVTNLYFFLFLLLQKITIFPK